MGWRDVAGAPAARRTARSAGDCRPRRAHRSGGRGDVRGCCRRPLGAVRADRYRTRRRRRDRRGDPARGDVSGRRDRPDPRRPGTHARSASPRRGRSPSDTSRPTGQPVGSVDASDVAALVAEGDPAATAVWARRRRCPGHACSPEPWRRSTSRCSSSAGVSVAPGDTLTAPLAAAMAGGTPVARAAADRPPPDSPPTPDSSASHSRPGVSPAATSAELADAVNVDCVGRPPRGRRMIRRRAGRDADWRRSRLDRDRGRADRPDRRWHALRRGRSASASGPSSPVSSICTSMAVAGTASPPGTRRRSSAALASISLTGRRRRCSASSRRRPTSSSAASRRISELLAGADPAARRRDRRHSLGGSVPGGGALRRPEPGVHDRSRPGGDRRIDGRRRRAPADDDDRPGARRGGRRDPASSLPPG